MPDKINNKRGIGSIPKELLQDQQNSAQGDDKAQEIRDQLKIKPAPKPGRPADPDNNLEGQ